jgi:hypothetical protein
MGRHPRAGFQVASVHWIAVRSPITGTPPKRSARIGAEIGAEDRFGTPENWAKSLVLLVELRGIEPLTLRLPA